MIVGVSFTAPDREPLRDSNSIIGSSGVSTDVSRLKKPMTSSGAEARSPTRPVARRGADQEVGTGQQLVGRTYAHRRPRAVAPTFEGFLDRVHPDPPQQLAGEVTKALESGPNRGKPIDKFVPSRTEEKRYTAGSRALTFDLDAELLVDHPGHRVAT